MREKKLLIRKNGHSIALVRNCSTGIPLQDIVSFAYPYGSADETVMNKVWKCGYQSGGGLGQIPVDSGQNRYYFSRYPVTSDMTIKQFAGLFDAGDDK